jgi:hemerythrin
MSEIFKWDEKYSVYDTEIDKQHQQFFNLINKFYTSMASNQNNEAIKMVVAELKAYALKHFTHEESVMRRKDYPRLASHQKAHKMFSEKITELEDKLKAGKLISTLEISKYLKEWLSNHILLEDKQYANYFKNNNL